VTTVYLRARRRFSDCHVLAGGRWREGEGVEPFAEFEPEVGRGFDFESAFFAGDDARLTTGELHANGLIGRADLIRDLWV
jgi:hypothetical protein